MCILFLLKQIFLNIIEYDKTNNKPLSYRCLLILIIRDQGTYLKYILLHPSSGICRYIVSFCLKLFLQVH